MTRTTEKRKYLYRQTKGDRVYVYFRHPRTKQLTALPDDETSQAFANAYDPLLAAASAKPDETPRTPDQLGRWKNPRDYTIDPKIVFRPGSIGWFIDRYKQSAKFLGFAAGTRSNYGFALDLLKKEFGTAFLHDVTPEHVDVYSARIARQKGGATADQQINLISNLWEFAKGFAEFKRKGKHCPTTGATRHYQHDGEGHLAWPEAVLECFDETANSYLVEFKTGLHYTGQRGSDVVTMRWSDYDGELINVVQQKTGERVWLHCPAPLRTMLDRMQKNPVHPEFIFTNKWKRPYVSAGTLSAALRHHLHSLGYREFSMHGLRKNAAMELALAGCEVGEIQSVLGHKSPKMAMFYCKAGGQEAVEPHCHG
ncbi:MAG TPA: tyrosine-type recombinase/integrase [Bradyrhizobium sp.]|nr:tyrosine-type recombinase/integrase [Bradyrhizobium sp.]